MGAGGGLQGDFQHPCSHAAASVGSRQEEQARTLGCGCPTTWLQGPHSFISLVGGNYLEMTRVDSVGRVVQRW